MPFAQLVVGAPGAGKSTYCDGMQQFMAAIERPCAIVNLDPANDHTSYPAALDVRDLVTVDEVMEQEELGPNGGMIYALEELEHNFEWLEQGLRELGGMSSERLIVGIRVAKADSVHEQTDTYSLTARVKSSYSRTTILCAISSSVSRSSGTESAP